MSLGPPPLPNFIIVGASRSGTTSLYDYLGQHPQICMGQPKEVRFFDRDAEYRKGLDAYRQAFAAWNGEPAIGEASPSYFARGVHFDDDGRYRFDAEDDAARRIARDLPRTRILISLRDPVRRAYSLFWKNRQQGRERREQIRDAVEDELSGRKSPERDPGCLVYKNRYSIHVDHWIRLFGEEQVRVLVFEEWTRRPAVALREVAAFLGVDEAPVAGFNYEVHNQGWKPKSRLVARALPRLGGLGRALKRANKSGYPPLDAPTESFMRGVFSDDIEAIERTVGRELPAWRAVRADPVVTA